MGFFPTGVHADRGRGSFGSGAIVSLRTASTAGGGSSDVPAQNALVGWNDPPGLEEAGVAGEEVAARRMQT